MKSGNYLFLIKIVKKFLEFLGSINQAKLKKKMFGKPSRYTYTDPMKVMDQDGVPLTVKDKDDKSLTGFTFP